MREEGRMNLKEIADLATALSLVVASITLIYTLLDRNIRERRSEIEKWQRVVIFKQIDGFARSFDDIKRGYIDAAMQSIFPIPKSAIQDRELLLALLSLVEARLIAVREDGKYAAIRVSSSEEEMRRKFLDEMAKREARNELASSILVKLETESGRYSQEQLFRELSVRQPSIEFNEFNMLITNMRRVGDIAIAADQKVWLRSQLPPARMTPSGGSEPAKP